MERTNSFAEHYLLRHSVTDKIQISPNKHLRFIIVIPSFDEPALIQTLQSLWLCKRPASAVEIIVVINSPDHTDNGIFERNQKSFIEALAWAKKNNENGFTCHILNEPHLPVHEAGPGFARKIGMDQAILRFNALNRPDGIIISFDADSLCRSDYLQEIEKCFNQFPDTLGGTIYFEHPVTGKEFSEVVYNAVTEYELHLRYTISALRHVHFPYAYHTVGSCFCVTASTYVNQGGINKRKGGEDFYFLQKIIPLGHFREINGTCVYPSPRPSERAPFGTGAVIKKFAEGKISNVETYHPDSFEILRELFSGLSSWFRLSEAQINEKTKKLPEIITEFTGAEFQSKILEINNNSSSPDTFIKRFYQWFNMFRVIKFLNFAHKKDFLRVPVKQAAMELLDKLGHGALKSMDSGESWYEPHQNTDTQKPGDRSFRDMSTIELLEYFRELQKGEQWSGLESIFNRR